MSPNTREELNELIASCEVISEYADRAALPEVEVILSRLLFVLTDGAYGSASAEVSVPSSRDEPTSRDVTMTLRDQFRAFARITGPG